VQYAAALSLRVIAVDTGADKKALCHSYGAEVSTTYFLTVRLMANDVDVRSSSTSRTPETSSSASRPLLVESAPTYVSPVPPPYLMSLTDLIYSRPPS
jgi:D-arabinose 1-dehydrogenase-like Zn-dependent alcohol dehydrogenase